MATSGMQRRAGAQRLPSGRHNLPREFVVNSQRERMFDAMARAVSTKGYSATSVADVISLAGVSRKTFYDNFADKEACFLAAYDAIVPQFVERIEEGFSADPEAGWARRIRAGIESLLRFLAAEPDFARMCIVEVLSAGDPAIERRDAVMRGLALYFTPERIDDERVTPLPEIVPESVVAALHGLVYSAIVRGELAELPDSVGELTYVALLPFLGHEEAHAIAYEG